MLLAEGASYEQRWEGGVSRRWCLGVDGGDAGEGEWLRLRSRDYGREVVISMRRNPLIVKTSLSVFVIPQSRRMPSADDVVVVAMVGTADEGVGVEGARKKQTTKEMCCVLRKGRTTKLIIFRVFHQQGGVGAGQSVGRSKQFLGRFGLS